MPFIAITEAVFTRLLAEQYDTLQRAVDAEHVLTRAVLDGAGVDGIAELARERRARGGRCCWTCTGCRSRSRARARRRGASASGTRSAPRGPRRRRFSLTMLDEGHHVWVQPVGAQGRVEAFLAVGTPRATLAAGPDRRRPRAQPVRDRAGEVARGRRGRAPLAGRLLRRARPRRAAGDRGRPRAHPLRVRARRAGAGRRDRAGRRRAPTRPGSGSPPPTIARGSRAGSSCSSTSQKTGLDRVGGGRGPIVCRGLVPSYCLNEPDAVLRRRSRSASCWAR